MNQMSKRNKNEDLENDLFDPDTDVEEVADGLPGRNELVVATIQEVTKHGCYVSLDEYNRQKAYVHISEISRTWVKNIRTHVREGQRIVAKVLRVDPRKGQIDLSIKRVPEQMKKLTEYEEKYREQSRRASGFSRGDRPQGGRPQRREQPQDPE